jgi:hypothetical protein
MAVAYEMIWKRTMLIFWVKSTFTQNAVQHAYQVHSPKIPLFQRRKKKTEIAKKTHERGCWLTNEPTLDKTIKTYHSDDGGASFVESLDEQIFLR